MIFILSIHDQDTSLAYGYRDFSDQPGHSRLIRWLFARAWVSAERPSLLFDLATAWLVERKVLLPGVTVLAREVAQAGDRAAARLWRVLANAPNARQRNGWRYCWSYPRAPARAIWTGFAVHRPG